MADEEEYVEEEVAAAAEEETGEGEAAGEGEEAATEEVDEELETMKQRLKEMEDEGGYEAAPAAAEAKPDGADARSVFVGGVDFSTKPEELQQHFEACGTMDRVTILCDKYTGRPKGYAYIEFEAEESVELAIELDGKEFKGRTLKVGAKRKNVPGRGRKGKGKGKRGKGKGKGKGRGYAPRYHPYY